MNQPNSKPIPPEILAVSRSLARHITRLALERGDEHLQRRVLDRLNNEVPLGSNMDTWLQTMNRIWEDECLGEWPSDFPQVPGSPDKSKWN